MSLKNIVAKFLQTIKNYFKTIFHFRSTYILLFISLMAVFMSLIRVLITRQPFYLFMNTNLFLAFIPWFFASFVYANRIENKLILCVTIFFWLLFFPNAPYMLTDLIHLRVPQFRNAPLWYDLIMLLTFGFAGLYYGFISLQMIEEKISTVFNCRFSKWISIGFIYISCFGIYLGRFLRFNSWDLFGNFSGLMKSVLCRVVMPVDYWRTWGFTILAGTLLNVVYVMMKGDGTKIEKK